RGDRLACGSDERGDRCAVASRNSRCSDAGVAAQRLEDDPRRGSPLIRRATMETMHYHRPNSVADAVKLAGQHGDDKLLAGGQTTLPSMRLGLLAPTGGIDLAGIAELPGVSGGGHQ